MNALSINKRSVFILLLLTLALGSCKKGGNSTSPKTASLTNAAWTLQKMEIRLSDGSWGIDPFDSDPTGHNQITWRFFDNGTFAETDDGQNIAGTWLLSSDQKELTVSSVVAGSTVAYTYTVTALTSSTLQIIAPGVNRETYGH